MKSVATLFLASILTHPIAAATLTGVVYTDRGEPLENALVTASRPEGSEAALARLSAGTARASVGSAKTDAHGEFTLANVPSAVLEIAVEREGFAPASRLVPPDEKMVTFDLPSAKSVRIRVQSGAKPVDGAVLVAWSNYTALWSSKTDAAGVVTMPDPAGWCETLTVHHPDLARLTLPIHFAPFTPSTISLSQGVTVNGAVTDAKGRPVPGAALFLGRWPAGTADGEGQFTLRHVPPDTFVIARKENASGGARPGEGPLNISLIHESVVTGTVRDAGKRPIEGVLVAAWGDDENFEIAATDAKGEFRLGGLQATEYLVNANPVGTLEFEPVSIDLRKKSTGKVELVATAAAVVRGSVTDEQKRPIAGASVQWLPHPTPIIYASLRGGTVRTDRTGQFQIPKLATGAHQPAQLRLLALHPGFAGALVSVTDERSVSIVLPAGRELHGLVTDAEGKGIAGAGVILMQDPFGARALPLDGALESGNARPFVESAEDGTFSLRLNDAVHDLGVWKKGYAGFRQSDVRPGAGTTPLHIVLDRGVQLRGRVMGKGTAPVYGGLITAALEGQPVQSVEVSEAGTFAFEGLRAGVWELYYRNRAGLAGKKVVELPAASEVVVELPATGRLQVRVIDDATQRPLSDFELTAQGENDFRMESAEGRASIELEMVAGTTEVAIRAEGYVETTETVVLEEGKTAELNFRMRRGRSLSGRVLSEDGTPLTEAQVSASADPDWFGAATSDEQGVYRLDGLPSGEITLHVSHDRYLEREAVLQAGEAGERMDLVLVPGRTVSGRVVASDGSPIGGVSVTSGMKRAVTGDDGRFRLEGLGNERLNLYASHPKHGRVTAENVDPSTDVLLRMKDPAAFGRVRGVVRGFAGSEWMMGSVFGGEDYTAVGRDGKFLLERLPEGEVELRATATSAVDQVTGPPVKVTVIAGGEVEVELTLGGPINVSGVVTANGVPLAGAQVSFVGSDSRRSRGTTTRSGGSYEVRGLEADAYEITVDRGRTPYSIRRSITSSGTVDIAIEYETLSGRVVDAQGKPLQGVSVEVAEAARQHNVGSATTNAAGEFSIQVSRNSWVVTATRKGYSTATQRVESAAAPLLITMLEGEGLRLRLLDARSGATLNGFAVATTPEGIIAARAGTRATDGTYPLPLPPGDFRLSVSADGFASQSVRVSVPAAAEVRLSLTPGGTLIVRTEDAAGDLVKLVMASGEEYVRCQCNGIAEIRLTGNTTTVDHVAPGAYNMIVLDEDGRTLAAYPVTIAEGATTVAEVHLPR